MVTGAGSGIGRATALAFARAGARVVVSDVLKDMGERTVALIREEGGEALFVECDVAQVSQVEALVGGTVKAFGRMDCAFNNAGIEGHQAQTADSDEENFDRVIAVNLRGVFLSMKYEIRAMVAQGGGAIVNNASVAALVGFAGLPAYCASKGGVIQLTRTAALEYADKGIRINAVCPGVVRTQMIDRITGGDPEAEARFVALQPVGRMGTPEEIANAVVWLCSDQASFVTGHPMVVDGGLVAR